MASTTSAAAATATVETTISISDHSPNPDNNLYDVNFQAWPTNTVILTTVTSDSSVVSSWISSLSNPRIVGLDVEWRPNRSRNHDNPVATLQLCTLSPSGTHTCLIFQILHCPPPLPKLLVDFLANDRVTFVGAGIKTDIERLLGDYDLSVAKTADLGKLAKEMRLDGLVARQMIGLKNLTRVVLGVEVEKPKSVTMSRWDCGWLSYSQIQYACIDAFLSYEVGARLSTLSSAIYDNEGSTVIATTDPLYYNPSEGTQTLKVSPILSGIEDYGPWKRQMQLALSAKRKLGYVTGQVTKPTNDTTKLEAWEASNHLVISWILQNVSDRIKRVVMKGETAKEVWDILQRRYTVANGARKYKLNKETYEVEQSKRSIEEYYTQLQIIWDDLENISTLPTIAGVTDEVKAFMKALDQQNEERRLFQLLNGLDKEYSMLRSNILLMNPLPTVDDALSMLLQEEAQNNNSNGMKIHEGTVFMSKGENYEEQCEHCGRKNHRSDSCWEIVGYPAGHPKNKQQSYRPGMKQTGAIRGQKFNTRGNQY